ncbi:hypothetical protein QUF80_12345 [Desulfococcaceae bacterium HSG8]|nr:hypothetical protein [Desulfococcaceae bacterium HSG8]
MANPPHLTCFGFANPNRATPWLLAGDCQIPRTSHASDLPIRTEQHLVARGGLANPPHLTCFGFVNPNRAAPWLLAGGLANPRTSHGSD